MGHAYLKEAVRTDVTPQSEPIPGSNQVANSGGGFSFAVDKWTQLERFLVLGAEGGSYYAAERKLVQENAKNVTACIAEDGPRAVKIIEAISVAGRAPKNDPALFALAMAASSTNKETRAAALVALPNVARIGTHLFHFAEYVQVFRGWGRGLREGVATWYQRMPTDKLAYQMIKYQNRNGWTHRDLLRLAHPKPKDEIENALFRWAVKGYEQGDGTPVDTSRSLKRVWAFERAKALGLECVTSEPNKSQVMSMCSLINNYFLPRECVPTQFLKNVDVQESLLVDMPMTAMVRNLANMTISGLLSPNSSGSKLVLDSLGNEEALRKSRLHPFSVLVALMTYQSGRSAPRPGRTESKTWTPVRQIVDALDEAFYKSFQFVPSTGKRWYLGLDVSQSMNSPEVMGVPGLSPRMASSAMAMVTMRTEKMHYVAAFSDGIIEAPINPRMSLTECARATDRLDFSSTDCSLPMVDAMKKRIEADVFVIYTDNETNTGSIHPIQALEQYRQRMGIPAKLVVVGMTATNFSIADPRDAGTMDVVGFDTAAPGVISQFVSGVGAGVEEND